jgi:hypothetical protein
MSRRSSRWDRETFTKAVEESVSIRQTLTRLGVDGPGHYKTFHKYKRLYEVSTDHFLPAWKLTTGNLSSLKSKPLEEVLVQNSTMDIKHIKKKIIREGVLGDYACSECGAVEWMGKPLSLHLDHINGDRFDNRKENLRFLCPNCHSQTSTYCGKNISTKRRYATCKCGGKKLYSSSCCSSCALKNRPTKIDWPSIDELKRMVEETSYSAVGRQLGVSDNAIRKRLKL